MQVEEGWWEGVLNGKSGMFPSNFTKEILLDSDASAGDSQEELRSSRTSESQQTTRLFFPPSLLTRVVFVCMCR